MSQSIKKKDDLAEGNLNENLIANRTRTKHPISDSTAIARSSPDRQTCDFKNDILLEDILDYKKAQLLNSPQVLRALRDKIL